MACWLYMIGHPPISPSLTTSPFSPTYSLCSSHTCLLAYLYIPQTYQQTPISKSGHFVPSTKTYRSLFLYPCPQYPFGLLLHSLRFFAQKSTSQGSLLYSLILRFQLPSHASPAPHISYTSILALFVMAFISIWYTTCVNNFFNACLYLTEHKSQRKGIFAYFYSPLYPHHMEKCPQGAINSTY